jgi:hypothetical protein
MSQIVGHILLERYGDENFHSHLMSTTRGMLVGLAAADAAADADA